MIKYNNIQFTDYLALMYFLIDQDGEELNEKLFPHSKYFFIRAALEDKFKKKFTLRQVKTLLAEELALNHITLHKSVDNASLC